MRISNNNNVLIKLTKIATSLHHVVSSLLRFIVRHKISLYVR